MSPGLGFDIKQKNAYLWSRRGCIFNLASVVDLLWTPHCIRKVGDIKNTWMTESPLPDGANHLIGEYAGIKRYQKVPHFKCQLENPVIYMVDQGTDVGWSRWGSAEELCVGLGLSVKFGCTGKWNGSFKTGELMGYDWVREQLLASLLKSSVVWCWWWWWQQRWHWHCCSWKY